MAIFRVTARQIRTILDKKVQNGQATNIEYLRGKQSPANKISAEDIEQAQLFLLSVPSYESHYGREKSDKKYIPEYHSKASLFQDFHEAYPSNRVHYQMFLEMFKDLNLSIKQKAADTCKTCDELFILVKSSKDEAEKQLLKEKQKAHWDKWQVTTAEKQLDAEKSKNDSSLRVVAYDLEKVLPTPYLTTSVAFYSRQLSTFNLTIFDLSSNESVHNIWHEAMAPRGANEINSCIHRYGLNLPGIIFSAPKLTNSSMISNCLPLTLTMFASR